MTNFKCFASLVFAASIVPALPAETHCPGNVASLPIGLVHGHQITLSVSINHTGPYNFQLDTGTQVTMIDPSLATKLHLGSTGAAMVAGAGSVQSASTATLDLLEAGSHSVANQRVILYAPQNLQSTGLHIQGVLGEDFLEHFDILIDNAHHLLCLDDTGAMRAAMKGTHIPLVASDEPADGGMLPGLPIIAVHLTGGKRPVRLILDSGASAPILYNTSRYMALQRTQPVRGSGVDGAPRIFSALPLQDLTIGPLALTGVPFFSLAGSQTDPITKGFDGVLTIEFFRSVFIDHAEHFAILASR
jgi:Aspartyl protease